MLVLNARTATSEGNEVAESRMNSGPEEKKNVRTRGGGECLTGVNTERSCKRQHVKGWSVTQKSGIS